MDETISARKLQEFLYREILKHLEDAIDCDQESIECAEAVGAARALKKILTNFCGVETDVES